MDTDDTNPIVVLKPKTDAAESFDYGALDPETRALVQEQRDVIRRHAATAAHSILRMGVALIAVKEGLPHGQFGRWLEAEFAWSQDTAERHMAVARAFDGVEIPQRAEIAVSALYELAAPSTPPEVVAEMVDRARAGQPVRRADVAAAIAARRPKAEVVERPAPERRSVELRVTTNRYEIAAVRYVPDPDRRAVRRADHAAAAEWDARDTGKIIDVTGYLRPEAPAVPGDAEEEAPPDLSPENRTRIDRFERVHHAHGLGRGPNARFWRAMNLVMSFTLDPYDPDADPAAIVAAMADGEELDEAEAIAADLLRWAELLVAAVEERRAGGR
ncbi:MAG: DUF3102 domain-containing protein [Chloroflexota bacterium]|nr:DUF3102 domain-containing protein [Chloroflexota bacterium]